MSNISISFNNKELSINPGWIHDIMFLIVREFEKDESLIVRYNLAEIIADYKYFYSIDGDAFENPTSFDELFKDNEPLLNLFKTTLGYIKNELLKNKKYLTLSDLEGNVDIGIKRSELNIAKLTEKVREVEELLQNK